MADVATALTSLLANDATVSGLVGARIGPWQALQGEVRPFVAYQQTDGTHEHSFTAGQQLGRAFYQFNCVADTYLEVTGLANAVREQLSGYRGTSEGVVIQSCLSTDERDVPVPPIAGQPKPIYTRQIDFSVWFTESAPTN